MSTIEKVQPRRVVLAAAGHATLGSQGLVIMAGYLHWKGAFSDGVSFMMLFLLMMLALFPILIILYGIAILVVYWYLWVPVLLVAMLVRRHQGKPMLPTALQRRFDRYLDGVRARRQS